VRPWRVRRVGVPHAIAATFACSTANYAAAFASTTDTAETRTPLEWARATFEGAPSVVRWCLVFGWTRVLRLKLEPRNSDGHVLGWSVADSDLVAEGTELLAASRFLRARNIVMVDEATVTWMTLVHYSNAAARPMWAVARPIHHLTIRCLLARAARASTEVASRSGSAA
jgi:hypothetical protein